MREMWQSMIEILKEVSKSTGSETAQQKCIDLEERIEKIPTQLEELSRRVAQDKPLNSAIRKMDGDLIQTATEVLKDSGPYVFGKKIAPENSNYQTQFNLAARSITHEMDTSGLSDAIVRLADEICPTFSFSTSRKLIEEEARLLRKYGYTKRDVVRLAETVDKHKLEVLAKLQSREPETGATRVAVKPFEMQTSTGRDILGEIAIRLLIWALQKLLEWDSLSSVAKAMVVAAFIAVLIIIVVVVL